VMDAAARLTLAIGGNGRPAGSTPLPMIPIADDQVSCCAKGPTAPAEGCLKAQSG
jgi:hypothetical protein